MMERVFERAAVYCTTVIVTGTEPVTGFPPAVVVVADMLIMYVPTGVPGFLVLDVLPPHEPNQSVEKPNRQTSPSSLIPRSERRREPTVNMIPNKPGSSAA